MAWHSTRCRRHEHGGEPPEQTPSCDTRDVHVPADRGRGRLAPRRERTGVLNRVKVALAALAADATLTRFPRARPKAFIGASLDTDCHASRCALKRSAAPSFSSHPENRLRARRGFPKRPALRLCGHPRTHRLRAPVASQRVRLCAPVAQSALSPSLRLCGHPRSSPPPCPCGIPTCKALRLCGHPRSSPPPCPCGIPTGPALRLCGRARKLVASVPLWHRDVPGSVSRWLSSPSQSLRGAAQRVIRSPS